MNNKFNAVLKVLYVLAILIACENKSSNNKQQILSQNDAQVKSYRTDSILIESKITHYFSNKNDPDKFHIYIMGESIINGTAHFEITNANKILLFTQSFPADQLVGYGLSGENLTTEKIEHYIKKRIEEFFDEDCFAIPAIGTDETFDQDYSDQAIWEEIKAEQDAIGFYYIIGEEDGKWIAFSNKNNKVVTYFSCC